MSSRSPNEFAQLHRHCGIEMHSGNRPEGGGISDRRSPMIPEPTTAASRSAVPAETTRRASDIFTCRVELFFPASRLYSAYNIRRTGKSLSCEILKLSGMGEEFEPGQSSTRMRRGVPGPPGNKSAASNTKSTRAMNATSGSTIGPTDFQSIGYWTAVPVLFG